jgi:predicted small lipoprotein YifL
MNKSMRITLSAALLALLAGCGAKGPLILPEKAVPIEVPTETAPESIPPVDSTQTDAVPTEPKAGDTSETPAHPGEG